jgi:hypothetical protein
MFLLSSVVYVLALAMIVVDLFVTLVYFIDALVDFLLNLAPSLELRSAVNMVQ